MINFNQTSRIIVIASILSFITFYFIGITIPNQHALVKFGYDTSILLLAIGYILPQKNFQQLIGLFLFLIDYNLNLFSKDLFQIQNESVLYFARGNSFYVMCLSFVFLFPTLFDKYKLAPLTNKTNIKDRTVILSAIILTVLIQSTIRLKS
jgi:hypothetical protein